MKYLARLLSLTILLSVIPMGHAQDMVKSVATEATRAAFNELERQIIRKYYSGEVRNGDVGNAKNKGDKGMPPGLAKREGLPPGLAAQLQRNGTLPPGLAKRDLPGDLERQLPPVRKGYSRSVLEDMTVVLIEEATGRIADIIRDTARGDM